jgi:hypothetical protein
MRPAIWLRAGLDRPYREVLRPDVAPLLLPQPNQGFLVLPHDDPGIRAADEVAAVDLKLSNCSFHGPSVYD